ncbi:MAG: hypothetical protein ACYTFY_18570 [Planctomycetota bacterium]
MSYMDDNEGWQVVILDHQYTTDNSITQTGTQRDYAFYISPYLGIEWDDYQPISGPRSLICPASELRNTTDEIRNLSYGGNEKVVNKGSAPYFPDKITTFKNVTTTFFAADRWISKDISSWSSYTVANYGGEENKTCHTYKGPWNGPPAPYHINRQNDATLVDSYHNGWAFLHNTNLNMLYIDGHAATCQERFDGRPSNYRFSDATPYFD